MLAALLLNLEDEIRRGPILRNPQSISISRDVHKAAHRLKDILFPEYMPTAARESVKAAVEKVYDYVELPSVDYAGGAIEEVQRAISALSDLESMLTEPEWMVELRLVIQRLTIIRATLSDDEEALLLLL